jgi:hypothetical protein
VFDPVFTSFYAKKPLSGGFFCPGGKDSCAFHRSGCRIILFTEIVNLFYRSGFLIADASEPAVHKVAGILHSAF